MDILIADSNPQLAHEKVSLQVYTRTNHAPPGEYKLHLVRLGNVLERVLEEPPGGVALAVVAPLAGGGRDAHRWPVGRSTTQGLAALGVRALLVQRVEVGVRDLEHLELGPVVRRHVNADRRLVARREAHVPLVPGVLAVRAAVLQEEAADLRGRHLRDLHHLD